VLSELIKYVNLYIHFKNFKIMKKIILFTLFSIAAFITVISQNDKSFRFGLMGTPNIAWIKSNTEVHDYDGILFRLGYGLTAEFLLGSNYSFSTGLESNYSGGKMSWEYPIMTIVGSDTTISKTKVESSYKFQFLEIPLTLKMMTNEINYITYFARFGGSLGMRLDSKADYMYVVAGEKREVLDKKINDDIQFFRIAFVVGIGAEYSLGGATSAFFSLNFNNGLTNIFRKKGTNLYDDNDKKGINNYFSLNAGILF